MYFQHLREKQEWNFKCQILIMNQILAALDKGTCPKIHR